MKPDAVFDSAVRGLREAGASADEQELVRWITRHGQEEGELLKRYEQVMEQSASPATRYLVNLILEDERRHHLLLAEIAHAIAWGIVPGPRPGVPRSRPDETEAEVIEETKALLASEKRDRAELRKLRRRLRSYTDTLWPLLVDVMLADTDKHTRILEFIVKRKPADTDS